MTERVAVVTGASSGLGKTTAYALAEQGFRVIGIGRNPERCAAAEAELRASEGREITVLCADLSRMGEVDRVAAAIAGMTREVHLLVNNAGGMTDRFVLTDEGLEENFASNHLGPFRLTIRLLPLIREAVKAAPSGSVRIVNTSSDASEYVPDLPWSDLQMLNGFDAGRAYCHGKLANVMFARGLATRFGSDGIVAHAVHPGPVDTLFASRAEAGVQARMASLDLLTPEQGAETIVWVATADEPGRSNGGYFYERAPRTPNAVVEDADAVERLWQESERLIEAALTS
ncbi:MAG: SDR family NAD(P)-dependent oxidoreductase [Myxococcota bacterium]